MTSKKKTATKASRASKAAKATRARPASARKSTGGTKPAAPADTSASNVHPSAAPATVESAAKARASASAITLARADANFAALRTQLKPGPGKSAGKSAARHDKNVDEALKKLSMGYRKLLSGS